MLLHWPDLPEEVSTPCCPHFPKGPARAWCHPPQAPPGAAWSTGLSQEALEKFLLHGQAGRTALWESSGERPGGCPSAPGNPGLSAPRYPEGLRYQFEDLGKRALGVMGPLEPLVSRFVVGSPASIAESRPLPFGPL